jgi:preprotein translocase subunit SecY
MGRLSDSFRNIFKIQELRTRVIFTLSILIVARIGAHITLPGVDASLLAATMRDQAQDTLFGLYDLFVGGAFSNAAIFALGIMPYISASIIIQLLGAVVPYFQKLRQEGEEGRKKIIQLTRYGTVLIASMQAWGMSVNLNSMSAAGMPIVPAEVQGIGFTLQTMLFLTTGTVFLMWLGEQITERGIGNGISLVIFIGIIAQFPHALLDEYQMVASGARGLVIELVIIGILVLIISSVVLITQGTRRIPVQYAKRVVGRKVYGGVTQYIPMRVNSAGVMPIIFAQAIMFVPNTILMFFPDSEFMASISRYFDWTSFTYSFMYAILVIFFTYFYTAIAFNPKEVSDTLKKQGGFIPGIRPGKQTSDFLDNILTRITLPASIFLAIIAIMPSFAYRAGVTISFSQFFGGTSLLIMVGVSLDTLQQIESHLLMRHYDGFMKSGKMRGRRG